MNAYVASVIENVKKKYCNEPEFVQTVEEDDDEDCRQQIVEDVELLYGEEFVAALLSL